MKHDLFPSYCPSVPIYQIVQALRTTIRQDIGHSGPDLGQDFFFFNFLLSLFSSLLGEIKSVFNQEFVLGLRKEKGSCTIICIVKGEGLRLAVSEHMM